MNISTDDKFAALRKLLSTEAAKHGDGIEVQSRRGTNIVGISIYNLAGGYHSVENEWMDDELDGLPVDEALTKAWSIAFAKAEYADRAQNEK